MRNIKIIFLFLNQTYVVGAQKNCYNETVLLNTQNICLLLLVRKYSQLYAENVCLSKPVVNSKVFVIIYFHE